MRLNCVVPDPNDIPSETLNVRVEDPGVATPSAKGVMVNTLESWLKVAIFAKDPSYSTVYVKLTSALSLSVPVSVMTVGVEPSVSSVTAPLGSMVKVGVALNSAILYQPEPFET